MCRPTAQSSAKPSHKTQIYFSPLKELNQVQTRATSNPMEEESRAMTSLLSAIETQCYLEKEWRTGPAGVTPAEQQTT